MKFQVSILGNLPRGIPDVRRGRVEVRRGQREICNLHTGSVEYANRDGSEIRCIDRISIRVAYGDPRRGGLGPLACDWWAGNNYDRNRGAHRNFEVLDIRRDLHGRGAQACRVDYAHGIGPRRDVHRQIGRGMGHDTQGRRDINRISCGSD